MTTPRYVAWRWPQSFARAGGSQRLGELVVNDWKNGNSARQRALLANVRWWREDFPKLTPAERERLVAGDAAPGADPRQWARDLQAIQLLGLQRWNDARQLQIRALSNLQVSHHETMMLIIDNMRPSGRYEYNPGTGRYDRYVPYSLRRRNKVDGAWPRRQLPGSPVRRSSIGS